jgi:hypothetical protein
MIARGVATGLLIAILLRLRLVIGGLLLLTLDVLGVQDLLLLGNARNLFRVGLIDVYDGLLRARSAGAVRVDDVALSIGGFVHFLGQQRTAGTHDEKEREEDGAALGNIASLP